jgi:hypothetical protein
MAGERPKCPKGELERSWEVRGGFSLGVAYVWDVFCKIERNPCFSKIA